MALLIPNELSGCRSILAFTVVSTPAGMVSTCFIFAANLARRLLDSTGTAEVDWVSLRWMAEAANVSWDMVEEAEERLEARVEADVVGCIVVVGVQVGLESSVQVIVKDA